MKLCTIWCGAFLFLTPLCFTVPRFLAGLGAYSGFPQFLYEQAAAAETRAEEKETQEKIKSSIFMVLDKASRPQTGGFF